MESRGLIVGFIVNLAIGLAPRGLLRIGTWDHSLPFERFRRHANLLCARDKVSSCCQISCFWATFPRFFRILLSRVAGCEGLENLESQGMHVDLEKSGKFSSHFNLKEKNISKGFVQNSGIPNIVKSRRRKKSQG